MTYFRELPNVEYQNFLKESNGSQNYILMKNIFIRGKLRDDLQNTLTIFDKYVIKDGERPDNIADELYGDPGYDWVVLIVAEIKNLQNDYPLSSNQLYEYVAKKYGEENVNAIKMYQTREIRDRCNRRILPAGITVDKNYTIPDPDEPGDIIFPALSVTNIEYEGRLNDEKRNIYVLKPGLLNTFLRDMRDISKYGFNSEFIDEKTIRVANTKTKSP